MNAPCYTCPDRDHPHCYAKCEKYQAYHAQCEKNRQARRIQGEITCIRHNKRAEILRDQQRKARMK